MPRVKDQRETKDEPRNTERTPNHPKVLFVKIALATGLVLGDFPPSITCPFFVYCPAESPITLLAFCLFIISNTIEFSSLHRLYPIARRASYRRSRPITSWRFRAIRSPPFPSGRSGTSGIAVPTICLALAIHIARISSLFCLSIISNIIRLSLAYNL